MTLSNLNLAALVPEVILIVAALLVLIADLIVRRKPVLGWFTFLSLLGSLAATIWVIPATPGFQTMAIADGLGRFASIAIGIAAALASLLAVAHAGDFTKHAGAYNALLLLATAGMQTMTVASDFLTIFLGLEILSLALYVLVGFDRREARSSEAALKYFLLGAFASGFLLYGIALIYAATGTTNLAALQGSIAVMSISLPFAPLLPVGIGLLLVGFGFKVALVPFHMWTPDVYQGAPTPVTAFMSVGTKAAAFAALLRVLTTLISHEQPWLLALAVLSIVTMTLGNLAALRQKSIKRMLAYSSIAHAGYLLTGLAAGNQTGAQGALYYLIAYTFMNVGAFAVVLAVQRRTENDVTGEQLAGLAVRKPGLAALMAVFMFSLAGIPPLAGFFGKLYVFKGAVDAGMWWLAAVGVLNSAIGAFYYLRVTVSMYMSDAADAAPAQPGIAAPVWACIAIAAAGTVILGLWQYPWIQSITQAVATLAPW